jgi:hypothetical protein
MVVVTDTRDALSDIARAEAFDLAHDDAGVPLDLDAVATWIDEGGDRDPDPVLTLNAWDLFGDIGRSVGTLLEDRSAELDLIYDKIFAANNLPAMTPPGERFEPRWSASEVHLLRSLLARGLSLVREAVPPA